MSKVHTSQVADLRGQSLGFLLCVESGASCWEVYFEVSAVLFGGSPLGRLLEGETGSHIYWGKVGFHGHDQGGVGFLNWQGNATQCPDPLGQWESHRPHVPWMGPRTAVSLPWSHVPVPSLPAGRDLLGLTRGSS